MGLGGFAFKTLAKTALSAGWSWLLNWWKWLVVGVIVLGIAWIGLTIYGAFKDRAHYKEQLEGNITQLTVERDRAVIERDAANETLRRKAANDEMVRELRAELRDTQKEARDRARAQQEIFEKDRKHSFSEIVQAKPGLVENLANKATQERFDELEGAFND